MKEFIPYIILFVSGLSCGLFIKSCHEAPKVDDYSEVVDNLKKEHKKEIDEQGREIVLFKSILSEKETIIAALSTDYEDLHGNRDLIKKMYEEALKYAEQKDKKISQLTTLINSTSATITDTLTRIDTIYQGVAQKAFRSNYVDPDGWFRLNTIALPSVEKFTFDLTVKNAFSIEQYEEKGNSLVRVVNHNPYTQTLPGTNVFQLKVKRNKPRRFGLGVHAGMNQDLKPTFSLGINYNFLLFDL